VTISSKCHFIPVSEIKEKGYPEDTQSKNISEKYTIKLMFI